MNRKDMDMKVKARAPLPPWVDVARFSNEFYWVSPCIPWLPVALTQSDNMFDGVALSALLVKNGRGRKSVEICLERRRFTIMHNGECIPDEPCQEWMFATGTLPLKKFLDATDVPPGRSATSMMFTFYEDGIDVHTTSVPGRLTYDYQISAGVCRGYNRPRKMFCGQNYATMTFLFNEGAKSFDEWRSLLEAV